MEPKILLETETCFLKEYEFENLEFLSECIEEIDNQLIVEPKIIVFGKKATQHRSVGFFSNDSVGYHYSNQLAPSIPLGPKLNECLQKINKQFETDFNGILVNRYGNGNDYIGAHSDDESKLHAIGVLAISIGATRIFRIRDKKTRAKRIDVPFSSGKIIHMGGNFQKEFTHEIPKQTKIKEPRYSFTFRKHTE